MKKHTLYLIVLLVCAGFVSSAQDTATFKARQGFLQITLRHLDSIVRKTKNPTPIHVSDLLFNACMGHIVGVNHFEGYYNTCHGSTSLLLVPVMASDTAALYRWPKGSIFRLGAPQRMQNVPVILLPQHTHFYETFYLIRLFDLGYMHYWQNVALPHLRNDRNIQCAGLRYSRLAQQDMLEVVGKTKYTQALKRCVDSMYRAHRGSKDFSFARMNALYSYVKPACKVFGPAASTEEASYRQYLIWELAVFKLIELSSKGDAQWLVNEQLKFINSAEGDL